MGKMPAPKTISLKFKGIQKESVLNCLSVSKRVIYTSYKNLDFSINKLVLLSSDQMVIGLNELSTDSRFPC